MSRIIALWGCPDSGKTTLSVKLAQSINAKHGSNVICVFADSTTPALPVLFPNRKISDLRSIGAALSKTDITQDDALMSIVSTKHAKDIGFMGFTDGENRYSYPDFSREKTAALFDVAGSLADTVIVDCGSKLNGAIAYTAVSIADSIIRVCKPDLKAISFFSSQMPLYGDVRYRTDEYITVINATEQESFMPIQEAAQHFQSGIVIPYASELKRQVMTGQIFDKVSNKAFHKAMGKLIKTAVME